MKTLRQALLAVAVLSIGCVSQGKYDRAVAETQTTRGELLRTTTSLAETEAKIAERTEEAARLATLIQDLSATSTEDKTAREARIEELRKRLEQLRVSRNAAEHLAASFRVVAHRLQEQLDSGDLEIVVRDGRMVLMLPNDVLFDTGKTEMKPAGKRALAAVAEVMRSMPDRQFQVAGHTDNVPVRNAELGSNWELSSARALVVLRYLLGKNVPSGMLSAAGYADVDPVASNATPEGRKHNRRTEITLQPQIDGIFQVP